MNKNKKNIEKIIQKKYRKNMTDEQKQKDYQKNYQKEYRKNMTDEQKYRKAQKHKYLNMTNEKRQKYIEAKKRI